MSVSAASGSVEPAHDLRGLLQIRSFRRLWTALGLSSLGDWLGLFAMVALAAALTRDSYAGQNFAVAGVFLLRLAPAVIFGPIAGVVADRLDRRWTMIVCDIGRAVLFVSIPIIGTLWWLFVATFLVEVLALFWIPAKEATVPNIVPRSRLEAANQLSLVTAYGTAPIAAGLFTLLALLSGVLANGQVDLALYFNAATFAFSALTIARLSIPKVIAHTDAPSMIRTAVEGWTFVGTTPVVRGVVIGMLGAFAAGGVVVGLANTFVQDLGAGDAGFGVLVGTVFLGMAAGMFFGPRLVAGFSRRRLFGLSILGAGLMLALLALIANIVIAVWLTAILGALAGTAWVTGQTLIGLEVSDEIRGRTFAFLQSLVRITLIGVLAVAPLVSGAIGRHELRITDDVALTYNGAAITFFLAGLFAATVGLLSYREMDDRKGVSLWADITAAVRGRDQPSPPRLAGFFIAFEGGEGAGKSTQAELLAKWLSGRGHEVVLTHEPGATPLGRRVRGLLLDVATGSLAPRTEALLYAADRAEHVDTVIAPALARGAVVITDRFVDSSLAYQGAGRALPIGEVARLSAWATGGLRPDLTIVLDLPADAGLARIQAGGHDRIEAESRDFHDRVRQHYLELAATDPDRYFVIDAAAEPHAVAAAVRTHVADRLPEPAGPDQAGAVADRADSTAQRLVTTQRLPGRHARATPTGKAGKTGNNTGNTEKTGSAAGSPSLVDELLGPIEE